MEAPVDHHFDDPGFLDLDGADFEADSAAPPEPDWAFWDGSAPVLPVDAAPAVVSPTESVGFSITAAANARHAGNRAVAAELAALAETVRTSRRNPTVYLWPGALQQQDAVELAARAVAEDAGLQLQLTTSMARSRAYEGQTLIDSLPQLWALFRAGLTSYAHASAAVQYVAGLTDPAAIARYDTVLSGSAATLTAEVFRKQARTLRERLLAEPAEARHVRAVTERRVHLEPAEDGMAWLNIFLPAEDAIRITQRLTQTARTIHRREAAQDSFGRRTQMQIRTDLAAAWLAGDGTPTAATVRPILLVPILSLLGKSDEPAILHGYGPIDPATAATLFADAPAFYRAGTHPITGALLNLDDGTYRPTKAQRTWLTIKYGSCARPGCDQSSAMADIDHVKEWVRDHGRTDIDNLLPLCTPDHRLKTLSKIRLSTTNDPDGTDRITISTPTGFTATRLARARPAWWDDDPPF